MQSRVFWGRMETQDLDKTPLLGATPSRLLNSSYSNCARDIDTDKDSDESREGQVSFRMEDISRSNSFREDNISRSNTFREDNINRSNTFKEDNINSTNSFRMDNIRPIRISDVIEGGSEVRLQTSIDENCGARGLDHQNDRIEEQEMRKEHCCRTSGSQCQGHGSLDSGFSDSETSKSPGLLDDGTPRRQRRRRRKSRDRPKGNPRVNALFREHELLHTSTPKRDFPGARSRQSMIFTNDEEQQVLALR